MSVNYHAFQSRNVLFPESGSVCVQWRTRFSGYRPERIAKILNLPYDSAYLYLQYFGRSYRLCLSTGILQKKIAKPKPRTERRSSVGKIYSPNVSAENPPESFWTESLFFNETMAIYHLLEYTKDHPQPSGVWVPNTRLDGVSIRSSQPDPLLVPFSRFFTGKTELLRARSETLGGMPLAVRGDAAFLFFAFPQIPLRLIFWDADEEFPAQTQVLVDSHITDYLHYESVGCVVSDLLEKLESPEKQAQ